ncbi:cell division protein ZapD [Methylolobus aquaticus]|uniref:cell division protein ZapD n=1 Tax=Methylotetracoccus oryzae TaxID=1919059 RepID=UPI0011195637|nr:cell division protein ZapD [Methylotetracoccus oryzae]
MSDSILYEFPLNERIRVFMRLERLFQEIDYFNRGAAAQDSRVVVGRLIEVLTIFSRFDLRSELLKEIDRHNQVLGKLLDNPHVDQPKVRNILSALEEIGSQLYRNTGKLGQSLMEADLFKGIAQRTSIAGGTCSFDLPLFHYWLEQDGATRKADLALWLEPFASIRSAIQLLMGFLRSSATATTETADGGFFQKTLDHNLPFQLLRVAVDRRYPCFAEISGGKHRFTIRFMTQVDSDRPTPFKEDVDFRLTCCVL